jgi:DNA-binding response OmpR family regulator
VCEKLSLFKEEIKNMNENRSSLHFLCIGVAPSFIAHILEKTESLDVSLDTCKTEQEALMKMVHGTYEVYIVDIGISVKSALELVHEIRKRDNKKNFITIITSSLAEEENFTVLRDQDVINCLLRKPIDPQQIESFIKLINRRFIKPTSSPISDRMETLKREYQKTVPEKLDLLTKLIRSTQQYPDVEHVTQFKNAVHKIGGSAGSYGFTDVSVLCKDMDTKILERLAAGTSEDKDWIATFPAFLKSVEEAFKSSRQQETLVATEKKPREISKVFVVDSDINFLESLELIKGEFPVELLIESNPKTAMEKLQNPSFKPNAVITTQTFPQTPITGFEIIKTQQLKFTDEPTIFALLLEHDNIDTRIKAMELGVNYIFRKPVFANILLKVISDALHEGTPSDFKVLVLDDDVDFCNFVSIALSEIGVSVRSINNSTDLFKTLEEYKPHLLLLDLVLPKYDGLNLLKTLRQDVAYYDLTVVIVTSSEESMTRLSAYSAKADDILYKPLDVAILQKRILNFAERSRSKGEPTKESDISGLFHLKTLIAQLNISLAKPKGEMQYLVLFEINNFTDWLMEKDNTAINNFLDSINKQIVLEYNSTLHNFSYNFSKFALVFDEKNPKILEKNMMSFLTNLSKNNPKESISFNCCIIPITKNFGAASDILHAADECLNEISNKPPAPVRITVHT